MKHSPLCSRDGGTEIMFTAKDGDTKYQFIVPRELLDDECGDAASEVARKTWVNNHLSEILAVRTGLATQSPFNRVRVEEIA